MSIYAEPLYYEIAFSFVDIPKQVDLYEKFVEFYSKIPVKRVLDIGCGPSQQLREFARRGYEAVGLDRSLQMLTYLQDKARELGVNVATINADMKDFSLDEPVDLAFILMGTFGNLETKENLLRHLDSVAQSLNSGGLYLIENLKIDWHNPDYFTHQNWIIEKEGIRVESIFNIEVADSLNQILRSRLRLDVDDHGVKKFFEEITESRVYFPQEFITLIRMNTKFEFLGYFERNSTQYLSEALTDNITLLQRN